MPAQILYDAFHGRYHSSTGAIILLFIIWGSFFFGGLSITTSAARVVSVFFFFLFPPKMELIKIIALSAAYDQYLGDPFILIHFL